MTPPRLPSAEELAEHLFEEKCEHDDKPHCDQCTFDHLYIFRRGVLEAAAEKAKWKASTIGIMQHYQDGEANKAGEEFAIEILALKAQP